MNAVPGRISVREVGPRDGLQNEEPVPTTAKIGLINRLARTGVSRIEAVSFVRAEAVPQMADSEMVLEQLDPPDDVEIIGIVVNEKGADRAIATQAVATLGFPYSVSPTFLQKNQNQTLEDAIEVLEKIIEKADKAGLDYVVYISMAFGNPYGDLWNADEVLGAIDILEKMTVKSISLADTVGLATAEQVRDLVAAVRCQYDYLDIGVHLHSRPAEAVNKILAAYDAGCRRFDSAIGGLGGCPFAQDELIGNIPTEKVLEAMAQRGVSAPIRKPLDAVMKGNAEIAKKFSS